MATTIKVPQKLKVQGDLDKEILVQEEIRQSNVWEVKDNSSNLGINYVSRKYKILL